MIDHVGEQLARRRFGLHALEQLIARRAQKLDLHERKALVERIEDRRFALRHVGAVENELALLPRGLDQFGRTELRCRRRERCGECKRCDDESDHRVTADIHRFCSTPRSMDRAA